MFLTPSDTLRALVNLHNNQTPFEKRAALDAAVKLGTIQTCVIPTRNGPSFTYECAGFAGIGSSAELAALDWFEIAAGVDHDTPEIRSYKGLARRATKQAAALATFSDVARPVALTHIIIAAIDLLYELDPAAALIMMQNVYDENVSDNATRHPPITPAELDTAIAIICAADHENSEANYD